VDIVQPSWATAKPDQPILAASLSVSKACASKASPALRANTDAKTASPPPSCKKIKVKSGAQRAKRFVIPPLTQHLLCTSLVFLPFAARDVRGDASPIIAQPLRATESAVAAATMLARFPLHYHLAHTDADANPPSLHSSLRKPWTPGGKERMPRVQTALPPSLESLQLAQVRWSSCDRRGNWKRGVEAVVIG
jgi:hypothetical protein